MELEESFRKLASYDAHSSAKISQMRKSFQQATSLCLNLEPQALALSTRPVEPLPSSQVPQSLLLWRKRFAESQPTEAAETPLSVRTETAQAETAQAPKAMQIPGGTNNTLQACMMRQNERKTREAMTKQLSGHKLMSQLKVVLSQLTDTKKDLDEKCSVPINVLNKLEASAPEKLPCGLQIIADRMVLLAASSRSYERLSQGDVQFSLVYLAHLLCIVRPEFVDVLLGSLEASCIYIQPEYINEMSQLLAKISDKAEKKRRLGYVDTLETDGEYLLRMQNLTAFYAGLLLVSKQDLLDNYPARQGAIPANWSNPFHGLPQAWRWLARTLNQPLYRLSKYIVQAFLFIVGHDLAHHLPAKQVLKLFKLLQSGPFNQRAEQVIKRPDDDDRDKAFRDYVESSRDYLGKYDALPQPGRHEEEEGRQVWVNPRVLIDQASENSS